MYQLAKNLCGRFFDDRALNKEDVMKHLNSKRLVLVLLIALFPASVLQAQHNQSWQHGPPDAETRVAHLTSALDLSDEQSADLLAFFQTTDQERLALREQMIQEMAPQICALRADTEAELARILSPEQLALMEELKADRQQRGQGKRHNRNTGTDWQGMPDLDCSN
jgi:Spy/CpxP family protein refolding chaperone